MVSEYHWLPWLVTLKLHFFTLFTLRIRAIHDAEFHQNLLIHDISKIREGEYSYLGDFSYNRGGGGSSSSMDLLSKNEPQIFERRSS